MTQIKKYPRVFEMTGESVNVMIQFYKDSDGLEKVDVAMTSKVLPDERQVKIRAIKYTDGHVLSAVQNKKLPKPRVPDPIPVGTEISGQELLGRYGVLVQRRFPGSLAQRVIRMTGGFGCNKDGLGKKLFGEYACGGRDFAGRREDVWRFATTEEIDAARAETPL